MRCPKCKSERLVKAGFLRDSRFDYEKQRWLCKECGHYTVNPEDNEKDI